jgi:exopolysaccharide biosynthesis polyprenyl glycosylphosphotransferase
LELSHIFFACTAGLALLAIIIFFKRNLFDSRFIVLAGFILAILFISVAHIFVRWLQKKLYRYGIGLGKLVVVGSGKTADNFIAEFSGNKKFGWEVVKRIRDFSFDTAKEMEDYLEDNQVDEIIQCDPNLSKVEMLRLFDFANDHHIAFKYVADLLEVKVLRSVASEILGVPVVEVKRTTLEGWGRVMKRIMDIVISSLLIIFLSPVLLAVTIMIKLDSKGPVFFSEKDDGAPLYRVGEGGKLFKYFKFRSMVPNSDGMRYRELADKNLRGDGPLVKIKNDPRVTRVGKLIRRWSLDELPEIFLVFIGRMSLVGPRPHLPEEVAKYENHQRKTLTVKPGITGLAQVSGRSDLMFEEEVKLDVYYLENWSILLDFSILLKTPLAVLKHRETE